MVNKEKYEVWEMMVDRLSNQRGAVVRIVLKSPHNEIFEQSLKLGFKALNNKAEYEALINGLKMSMAIGISGIRLLTDSKLVAQQLNGGYETHDEKLV